MQANQSSPSLSPLLLPPLLFTILSSWSDTTSLTSSMSTVRARSSPTQLSFYLLCQPVRSSKVAGSVRQQKQHLAAVGVRGSVAALTAWPSGKAGSGSTVGASRNLPITFMWPNAQLRLSGRRESFIRYVPCIKPETPYTPFMARQSSSWQAEIFNNCSLRNAVKIFLWVLLHYRNVSIIRNKMHKWQSLSYSWRIQFRKVDLSLKYLLIESILWFLFWKFATDFNYLPLQVLYVSQPDKALTLKLSHRPRQFSQYTTIPEVKTFSIPYTMPFQFPFYGVNFSQIILSPNGFISLTNPEIGDDSLDSQIAPLKNVFNLRKETMNSVCKRHLLPIKAVNSIFTFSDQHEVWK